MRVLATAAAAFSAAIFLAQYLLPGAWRLPLALGLAVLGLGLLPLRHRRTGKRAILILLAAAAALVWDRGYDRWVYEPAAQLDGRTEEALTMTVLDWPEESRYGARATVRLATPGLPSVRAVYYGKEDLLELTPGCTVRDAAALHDASRIRGDKLTSFTSKGIFLLVYSRGEPDYSDADADEPRWWPQRFAGAMRSMIRTLYSGNSAGFLTAMLTGERNDLSDETASDFSEAGIYHILAVSGLHCSFLLAMLRFILGRQRRRLTLAVGIPVLILYALAVGCTPSVVRACIMTIFLLAAPLFGREQDAPTALSAALALILLQNPYAAASVSLQLSFAAVAGILWAAPGLFKGLAGTHKGRPIRVLAGSLSVSLGASVFTVPLSAAYFGSVCLAAPLSNLLCLWSVGVIFALGFLSSLFGLLWLPLGRLLAPAVEALIRYLLAAAGWVARVPYHAVYLTNPYLKGWLIFAYLLLFVCVFSRSGGRRRYLLAAGLGGIALVCALQAGVREAEAGRLQVRVLDVGQGQCVMLSSGDRFALLDCGSSNSWCDAGETAADALLGAGCRELDVLILTHYDYDHVSGVSGLLHRVGARLVLLPDALDDSGLRESVCAAAQRSGAQVRMVREPEAYSLGAATLQIYPPLGAEGSDNEQGLSLLCSVGDFDLLDTGDMDARTEQTLLARYPLPDLEVLIVGHHGSKNSTSPELLDALCPETAIISVGDNSYGHPTQQVLNRLADRKIRVYRTDRDGTVRLRVD